MRVLVLLPLLLKGGLLGARDNTGRSEQAVTEFDEQWGRSFNNSGGRASSKGGSRSPRKRSSACLYDCTGVNGVDRTFSTYVAHLAGSPDVYMSTSPADVRAEVNLVSAVRNQGRCGTCVSHVIASAAESAAAAAQRVDATLINFSHSFAYHCAGLLAAQTGGSRSCGTGWGLAEALEGMAAAPDVFFVNNSCTAGADPSTASFTDAQLRKFCRGSVSSDGCKTAGFKCRYKALSDGIAQLQQYIRMYGAVMTRLYVTPSFTQFFKSNRTGVFNGSSSVSSSGKSKGFFHAVLLVGYNNTGLFWYAKNSWGHKWGDNGFFRIGFGAADVGFPEDTYSLVDCFTTSEQPEAVAAWSDPWPVSLDPADEDCWLYTATTKDTISGMADHFQVNILDFIDDNTQRFGTYFT
eukprot:gene7443-7653_t